MESQGDIAGIGQDDGALEQGLKKPLLLYLISLALISSLLILVMNYQRNARAYFTEVTDVVEFCKHLPLSTILFLTNRFMVYQHSCIRPEERAVLAPPRAARVITLAQCLPSPIASHPSRLNLYCILSLFNDPRFRNRTTQDTINGYCMIRRIPGFQPLPAKERLK